MKYKHLTSFYGLVERTLAFHPDGSPRYFSNVSEAVQEAVKIKEEGPFNLITRVELIPDNTVRGDEQSGPRQPYWTPPQPKAPIDLEELKRQEARRMLQQDVYSGLTNFGVTKRNAQDIVRALPTDITDLSKALNWAMREAR